jgi:hypothetical protein
MQTEPQSRTVAQTKLVFNFIVICPVFARPPAPDFGLALVGLIVLIPSDLAPGVLATNEDNEFLIFSVAGTGLQQLPM